MEKIVLPIKGMHCRSCELLIEEELRAIPGVMKVNISYKKKRAEIFASHKLNEEKIRHAVAAAGYEVGIEDKKHWLTRNPESYENASIAILIFAMLFLWGQFFGWFDNFGTSNVGDSSSYFVILVIGLTAGLSTCMALIGGLVLSLSARHAEKHPEATAGEKFRPHLFFNLGRLLSYLVFGGMIGILGSVFQLSILTLGILTITVGIVMLIVGVQLTDLSPKISSWSFSLPSGIANFFGIKKTHQKEYSHKNSMVAGALTFFLPCGFTQAMQLYAMSTGSFLQGALIMGIFALGTLPGLLGIGGLTSIVRGEFAKKFFAFTGILVVFFAYFNISNGYNLTGWQIFPENISEVTYEETNVTFDQSEGVQIAKMEQHVGGYDPNEFVVEKGVPVRWVINSTNSRTCASSVILPKMGISKDLKPGENIIEFTPTEVGTMKFSCSMGMFTGKFIVVENSRKDSVNEETGIEPPEAAVPVQASEIIIPEPPEVAGNTQILKTTYLSGEKDIIPNIFEVDTGKPVQLLVDVEEDGFGCMSTMTIPGLDDKIELLEKGRQLAFNFTPTEKGEYYITCAMGVPRGIIIVQ